MNPNSSVLSNRLTILIVDDDQSALDLVNESLGGIGFDIQQSHNVEEALAFIKLRSSKIAMIVSDFNMPGGSGFDLRKLMLPEFIEIPFILLSGFVSREEALRAIDLKISGFVEKPFQVKALKDLVLKESALRVTSINEDEELRTGFVEEGRTLLDEMESIVLGFESHPDDIESINRLFACAHTIKGTSGYFKPDTTNRFTHRFEDFIVRFRGSGLAVDRASASVMLAAIDVIRELLISLETHSIPRSYDELTQIFSVKASVSDEPLVPQERAIAHKPEPKTDELKVSVALLDSFMERSGELTVLRNMVNKTLRLIEINHVQDQNVAALSVLLGEMHKTNVMMQEQMAELRKVPVRHVVKSLSRTVHDLAGQLKKKMRLEIRGEELRVDHLVAEVLGKCLIHIVRNSADHGLELPQERVEAGKSAVGTIVISAEQTADSYVISIKDDGRGINFERVVKKVIENGMASEADLEKMPRSQVLEFIFMPGFSTAAAVTDVSGRGVGTDMVKTSVESCGGTIRVHSETGVGSEFVLTIPVPKSVQIVSSLLVQANEQTFAVPQSSIRRVLRIEADDSRLQYLGDRKFFSESQALLPIVSLRDVLNLPTAMSESPNAHLQIVWIETKSGELGIEVDTILDVEDTVVKKVSNWIASLKVYAGATFLGDGRAGLVLDLDGVAQRVNGSATAKPITHLGNTEVLVNENQKKLTRLLAFVAGTKTHYVVKQDELFRLEDVATSSVQWIGETPTVLYRGAAMQLVELDGKSLRNDKRTNWPVVVVKMDETLKGFVVQQIEGFIESEISQDGTIVVAENRARTLISLVRAPESGNRNRAWIRYRPIKFCQRHLNLSPFKGRVLIGFS